MRERGFTFIELLVVLLIIGLLFSVVLPPLQERYDRYRGAIEAEKILIFLSQVRQEAFLYGKEIEITLKDGTLITQDGKALKVERGNLEMPEPLIFFPLGTTMGGKIYYTYGKSKFTIEIRAPFSELALSEGSP